MEKGEVETRPQIIYRRMESTTQSVNLFIHHIILSTINERYNFLLYNLIMYLHNLKCNHSTKSNIFSLDFRLCSHLRYQSSVNSYFDFYVIPTFMPYNISRLDFWNM